jgi:hypothetical protein
LRTDQHDPVHAPKHYRDHPSGIECIDVVKGLPFCLGNAVAYVWRHKSKVNPAEDIQKAIWYTRRQRDDLALSRQGLVPTGPEARKLQIVIATEPDQNMTEYYFAVLGGNLDRQIEALHALANALD